MPSDDRVSENLCEHFFGSATPSLVLFGRPVGITRFFYGAPFHVLLKVRHFGRTDGRRPRGTDWRWLAEAGNFGPEESYRDRGWVAADLDFPPRRGGFGSWSKSHDHDPPQQPSKSLCKGPPDMMSASECGHRKADVVREAA